VKVLVSVSSLGHTDFFFIDQGTKKNGQYYRDVLLHPCQPFATCLATSFQQDNVPAHRARKTVQRLITCETPDFIAPALWPANSPDLNPVDYQTWGKHRSRIHDVNQLKSRLIEEWEYFRQVFIDKAIM